MTCNKDYHSGRARVERNLAYVSTDDRAANAHLRLSALHLSRALLLEDVRGSDRLEERNSGLALPTCMITAALAIPLS